MWQEEDWECHIFASTVSRSITVLTSVADQSNFDVDPDPLIHIWE